MWLELSLAAQVRRPKEIEAMKFLLGSLVETQQFAEVVAKHVRPRDMIILAGEMGTGKTTFTQHLGKAMGITDLITSPTFNLLHNYGSGRKSLHHADLYRLERTGELTDLGLEELQDDGGVIVVEWGDIVGDQLGDALVLKFEHTDTPESRTVSVLVRGAQWAGRLEKLGQDLGASFKVLARG